MKGWDNVEKTIMMVGKIVRGGVEIEGLWRVGIMLRKSNDGE